MKRRDFLKIATGSAGGAAAVGAAGAQSSPSSSAVLQQEGNNSTANGTTTGNGTEGNSTATSGGGGGGTTKTVAVGPNGQNVFEPATVYVAPGDTVKWVWEGEGHNVHATGVPDEADWSVQTEIVSPPFEYEYTFDGPTGEYNYVCDPHASVGMEGTVVVNESGAPPEGEGGGGESRTPHEMGVPFQAHFVGIATILMMIVSLVYTFFVLKYGESRHASAPNKE
ncbi:plastocyanin/azurin family copper-binding protein [Halobacterium jilantaiense]|uniref:Tat (Twin-arginine translocation) pathway signal sequence n=1 Tax=Halobacterium jilantaiense TaxID=355548 RepID=A0A1I0NKN6_9EURY|nr:plastocyanin/azurin family copper-binding protein [Halobacterium jilantaiense]SEW01953.1 Tat (twin-arginine translocation) pathway signal sequence [Halobacterium jilantaiense]